MNENGTTANRMTRRSAIAFLMGSVVYGISGCGVAGPAVQVLLKLPWDKILSITVHLATGIAYIKGMLDGEEVEAEEKLSKDQVITLEKGSEVTVELKDDEKVTVKPSLKK